MDNLTTNQELKLLRSALIGLIAKDHEGSYKPEFVSEMFSSLNRQPSKVFKNADQFLEEVKKA